MPNLPPLKSHLGAALHLFIAALLWSVAIWDISQIIDDYVHDNRYTLVRTVDIENGTAPFLEDAEVCIQYESSIFQQIWQDPDGQLSAEYHMIKFEQDTNDWSHTMDVLGNVTKNGGEFRTHEEWLHGAKIVGSVYEMDEKYRIYQFCHDLPPVDEFLENYGTNGTLVDFWDKKIRKFILYNTPKKSLESVVQTRWFTLDKICNYVHVQNVSTATKDNKIFQFHVGIRNKNNLIAAQINKNSEIKAIEINFPNKRQTTPPLLKDQKIDIQVDITNVGLYDIREVTPQCQGGGNISQLNKNCKDDIYLEALDKFCNCTPFSFRGIEASVKSIRYCTQDMYNSTCMDQVRLAMANTTCGKACVTTKNNYDINSQIGLSTGSAYTLPSPDRISISFVITDAAYSVYQEKYKMSFSQLVAQIGGDIGIYTGFSMLAMWQFIVFFYDWYQKHQKIHVRKVGTKFAGSASKCRASIRAVVAFLKGKDGDSEENVNEDLYERLKSLEEEVRKLKVRDAKV